MPWKPSEPGEFPTLGWQVLDWMSEMLAAPSAGDNPPPFEPYNEQARFILKMYRLNESGHRVYRRALLGRPRGWGKSPLLAALAAVEALGPVVFDGWDANGQPVGRPWSLTTTPRIQISAVSDAQCENTWAPLLEMLRGGPAVDEYPGLMVLDSEVQLPRAGVIERITSSARTTKGAPTQFVVLDQTEEWVPSNGGRKLSKTIRDNAAKVNGFTVESPNAYVQGDESVAEMSARYAEKIAEGRALDQGLLYDNRSAPDVDLTDHDALIRALEEVYGDSAQSAGGHVNIERIATEALDPERDPEDFCREFLNQASSEADAFVTTPEWAGCGPHVDDPTWPDWTPPAPVTADDPVTLGFDGSRKRKKGVTDATALVACRVSDGLVWPVGVWEEPDGPEADQWEVPELEVETALADFMKTHRVVGFYGDPTLWESNMAHWEARWGQQLQVGLKSHPITWRTSQKQKTAAAVKLLGDAIRGHELRHAGSGVLTRHVLNARVRHRSFGDLLFKATPSSPRKIDAAYALMLAWRARLDAIAAGVLEHPAASSFVPMAIR